MRFLLTFLMTKARLSASIKYWRQTTASAVKFKFIAFRDVSKHALEDCKLVATS